MPGIVSFHGRGVGGPAVKFATEEYLLCAGFKENEGHFDRLGRCVSGGANVTQN